MPPSLCVIALTNGRLGRADDAHPAMGHAVHRGREHQRLRGTRTAVGDQERRTEARDAGTVTDVDADAVDHRIEHKILEVWITTELVDCIPAFDATANRVHQ